jgi:NhaA family Na+:H+ antiporter
MALKRLFAVAIDRSLLLVVGTVAALAWVNLAPGSYTAFAHRAHFLVNDIAMVFFFALATKEIVEATHPGGALSSWREAAVPLLAAAGGMLLPALLYAGAVLAAGLPELWRGWAIPCATDIAFSYAAARMIFPSRHPAIPFLLLLAVADDALGLVILAIFYPAGSVRLVVFALLLLPAVAIAWALRRRRVQSFWPYVLAAGGLSWTAFYVGGLHPALALVPIVPFLPSVGRYHELFDDQAAGPADTLDVFASWWRVPVQVVLFFFGLANAGVPLSSVGSVTWMVAGSLIAGKPVGVLLLTAVAVAAGLKRPDGLTYADAAIVGITAGIGFTVALFFATAAFPPGPVLDEAKMGALLSFVAAPLAIAAGRAARSRGRTPRQWPT